MDESKRKEKDRTTSSDNFITRHIVDSDSYDEKFNGTVFFFIKKEEKVFFLLNFFLFAHKSVEIVLCCMKISDNLMKYSLKCELSCFN